jgi:RNA polymerase sigma factor (sigma-70 family)
MDNSQLIQEYASSRSDDAFKALVDQYVGLVYSACLRQLKDRHLAEDATQAVFLLLSQKAGTLHQSYLTGWLLTTSRYACANIRKSEQRRQRREQLVAMNPSTQTNSRQDDLLDRLDEALYQLKAADREALILRYLKEQPVSDVAEKLGISQDAAHKRINRGVEKLRDYFSRRGITTTSGALGAILSEQVSGAALTGAARNSLTQGILQVCKAGPHGTAASVAIAKGIKTMTLLTKLKTVAALALIAVAIGTTGWMISRALADNAPAPQAAAPAAAPAAPAAAPTTAPSAIDLSTPENAARSFFIAVHDGDRARAYACLTADPNRPANLMDAVLAWNFAQNHLVRVVTQTFGGDGADVRQLVTLDTIAKAIAPNRDATPQAVVNGDTATLPTHIPDFVMAMAPADYRSHLQDWTNKTLYFQKQSGQWKFDIDRSMRVTGQLLDKNQRPFDPAVTIAVFTEYAQATEQIAVAVSDGQITSYEAAAQALKAAGSRIDGNYGISTMRWNVVPADDAK